MNLTSQQRQLASINQHVTPPLEGFFSKSNHSSAKIVTATTALVHFQSHTFLYLHLVLGANMFCPKYFFILAHGRKPLIRNTATKDEVVQKRLFLVSYSDFKNSSKMQIYPNLQKPTFQDVQKLVLLCQRIRQSEEILMPPNMTLMLLYTVRPTYFRLCQELVQWSFFSAVCAGKLKVWGTYIQLLIRLNLH